MQGGKPNLIWIFENCLLPELKAMSPTNDTGCFTDFKGNVFLAECRPDNMEKVNSEFRDTALLCWLDLIADSRTVPGGYIGDGRQHWGLHIYFIGGVKADRNIQIATATSAEDHKRVMRKNPARDQVGSTAANTWGINSTLVEPYRMIWDLIDQGIGKWDCTWCIDYSTPTTG
jgi:hypothetical protein